MRSFLPVPANFLNIDVYETSWDEGKSGDWAALGQEYAGINVLVHDYIHANRIII